MAALMSTRGSTEDYVLNPNVDIVKTTKLVTENGVDYEVTTYTAAPKQSVGGFADYAAELKLAGLAFLVLGLVGNLVFLRFNYADTKVNPQKRQILVFSVGSILLGLAMCIFSRSVTAK